MVQGLHRLHTILDDIKASVEQQGSREGNSEERTLHLSMRSKGVQKKPEKRFLMTTNSPLRTSRPSTSLAPAQVQQKKVGDW